MELYLICLELEEEKTLSHKGILHKDVRYSENP